VFPGEALYFAFFVPRLIPPPPFFFLVPLFVVLDIFFVFFVAT
jgi:hypothetical protein